MTQPVTKKRKTDKGNNAPISDPRFANIQSDPRYRLPGKNQRVKVDKRFIRALKDDDFSRRAKVDRFGRPLQVDVGRNHLRQKYEFEEGESESDEPDDDDEIEEELKRVSGDRDILREGHVLDSSDEDSTSDEGSTVEGSVPDAAELVQHDRDVPMGDVSHRIAVVNLDWDNIRAEDLMAVFNSFLPAAGRLQKVAIYPSDFGKERMAREEMEGPPAEIFASKNKASNVADSDSQDSDGDIQADLITPDDGSEFDSAALRQYQLERLRYFYAILTFSSEQSAKAIYDAVDGTEYLSTANFFDLRFVPDEVDFSTDAPREECTNIPPEYRPSEFVTDALQHSKVKLTWDAEDAVRKDVQSRAFRGSREDINENDLRAYLGSDSSESEIETTAEVVDSTKDEISLRSSEKETKLPRKEAERQRMRALLGLAPEPVKKSKSDKKAKAPTGNVQITFSSGLTEVPDGNMSVSDTDRSVTKKEGAKKRKGVFENSPEPNETTMEKYIRKEKERKAKRRDKAKSRRSGSEAVADPPTSAIEEEDLGFEDPFFAEPSATDAQKSANKVRKEQRLKKKVEREAEEAASAQQRAELEQLLSQHERKTGSEVKHFDYNEIEKAERRAAKESRKKGKKGKNKIKEDDAGTTSTSAVDNDRFKINTADPRFSRLYENHEFAIDPSNPRFKQTKAMRALLEEGRQRKQKTGKEGGDRAKAGPVAASNDVHVLVENLKRKKKLS